MTNGLSNKYFVRRKNTDEWEDITTKFVGVKVLSINGIGELGESVNVYNEQWIDSQTEDVYVSKKDNLGNDVIVRKNVDIELNFICGFKYGASDTQLVHDAFVDYMTKRGELYLKTAYDNVVAHVICIEGYKPTTKKLQRSYNSYIMGTIKLHTLDMPSQAQTPTYDYVLYIGFGDDAISTESEIQALSNVQHYDKNDIGGDYSINNTSNKYLWVCTNAVVQKIIAHGFEVPIETPVGIGSYRCYRSSNELIAHTMDFSIIT